MVTEVEVSELQDFQQLKAYVFLFFFWHVSFCPTEDSGKYITVS